MKKERSALSTAGTGIFTIVGIVYILPILIVLMNSFKKKVYINFAFSKLNTMKEINKNTYDRDDLAAKLRNASIEIQSNNRVPTSEEIKGFAILENSCCDVRNPDKAGDCKAADSGRCRTSGP